MKSDEYKYLEGTLSGRRGRDFEYEAQMTSMPEGSINSKAIERQRQLDSLTPEEREIEQRRYSLNTYGRAHMEKYGNPIVSERPLGELQIPGDQIGSAPPSPQLKGHDGDEPRPWCDANGKLLLQIHSAERQVLKVY